jgi:succinate dehydrogenase/fumarate reductase cytochrome b subunit
VKTPESIQKNGYLIALGGAVIALIGFLFLPYINMGSTQSTSTPPVTFSAIQAAAIEGFIWLEALLTLGILVVALLLAFSQNPFDMSQVARDKQAQRGAYTIIGVSALCLILQYILMTRLPGQLVGMFSTNVPGFLNGSSTFTNTVSMSYNVGSWFYLVGMLVAIGGTIYALQAKGSAIQGQYSSPYMPPVNPQAPWSSPTPDYQQNWQQPAQPAWPPQQQVPPTQQAWQQPAPPTQYPSPQRTWPPQPPSAPGQ